MHFPTCNGCCDRLAARHSCLPSFFEACIHLLVASGYWVTAVHSGPWTEKARLSSSSYAGAAVSNPVGAGSILLLHGLRANEYTSPLQHFNASIEKKLITRLVHPATVPADHCTRPSVLHLCDVSVCLVGRSPRGIPAGKHTLGDSLVGPPAPQRDKPPSLFLFPAIHSRMDPDWEVECVNFIVRWPEHF